MIYVTKNGWQRINIETHTNTPGVGANRMPGFPGKFENTKKTQK
jgi:hypothetical protein